MTVRAYLREVSIAALCVLCIGCNAVLGIHERPARQEDAGATPVLCGNGVVDGSERCDGNCPASCDDGVACTADTLHGSPSTCDAQCVNVPITECKGGDGCCPSGCDMQRDQDCSPACGNGQLDSNETCDGDCPTSCDDQNACTADNLAGSAATCNAACTHAPIKECKSDDGCCPKGCDPKRDHDCGPKCGNGVLEGKETCDGNCPSSCADDGNACTLDTLTGAAATCNVLCTHQAIGTCQSGDGCCPAGCTSLNDQDCPVSCGNQVVEAGESCDGSCPTSCQDNNACTTDVLSGSASACDAICTFTPITVCTSQDGCCTGGCDAQMDSDCTGIVVPCAVAAEGLSATLTCAGATTITGISFASYGTPTGSCAMGFSVGACDAASTLQIVQTACLGKQSCTIDASNTVFQDPCTGTVKTLAVLYTCGGP